ncbi:MAG: hypothetical protein ACLRX6_07195 [Limosilactobacillus pontis]|uniref:Lipoprotein n=1 Tax=Limosilactobacillus pontis TaxID=35787 RepID=A0A2J6NKP2_9LACO|nr:hypothetical protein [Limosilactobacillus pontis]PMB81917.1 hypothetical protein CK797_08530 [Limosilactobacillus pontis]
MNRTFKKVVLGAATLSASVLLAACGQQTTSSQSASRHSSSATPSAESESSKAYHSANKLIKQDHYQAAYNKLNNVSHRSQQVNNLSTDLAGYLDAKEQYSNGNYDQAASKLTNLKSSSPAMKNAYTALQNKITNAKKMSSSGVVSSGSNNVTSSSASSSSASSQVVSDQNSSNAVNNFANKMGFHGNGYQITPTTKNGNSYRFEVRQNNQDNTVANMVGIYQYNDQTGIATKIQ